MHVDYPAAHSMDTDWFAVDCHGHVGIFLTYEPGHKPAGWPEQTTTNDILDPLLGLTPEEDDLFHGDEMDVSVRRPPSNTLAFTRRDCRDPGRRVSQLGERGITIVSRSQGSRPVVLQIANGREKRA